MYYLLGLYEDAVAMYQRAIEVYPNEDSYANLGTAYFYLGRYDDALEAYRSALKLDSRNDVLYRNLGDAYLRVERVEEAQEQFKTAVSLLSEHLKINPDDAPRLADLAICQAKLGNAVVAAASIERAITLEPHNTNLMYAKAVVYALGGQREKAIEDLRRALVHGYSSSEARRDPDLETLREMKEYEELFSTAN